jgi:hypothetical protein
LNSVHICCPITTDTVLTAVACTNGFVVVAGHAAITFGAVLVSHVNILGSGAHASRLAAIKSEIFVLAVVEHSVSVIGPAPKVNPWKEKLFQK